MRTTKGKDKKKGNPESEPEFLFHSFLTNLKLLT